MSSRVGALGLATLATLAAGTTAHTQPPVGRVDVVEEAWITPRDATDNVDSVAVWHGSDDTHLLIATAKDTDLLQVFDAASGELLRRVGGTGDALGRFLRPNGIAVVDDLAVVVERDNRRVQVLSLPELQPLGAFGMQHLELPYGLWVRAREDGYDLYVTDAYELQDGRSPPDAELDRRIQMFHFAPDGQRDSDGNAHGDDRVHGHGNGRRERRSESDGRGEPRGNGLRAAWLGAAGATEGAGRLPKVESLFGDAAHDRLLVADETESDAGRVLKVYDLGGNFAGAEVGRGVYRHEPEGIALYACDDGSGYWFGTDQSESDNRFHVFDRESLAYVTTFVGANVRNTDGVWLTRMPMPGFPAGAFYAVHDDRSIGAFRLDAVFETLGLTRCKED